MTGFLAEAGLEENAISQALSARQAAGLPLIDLSSSNPTKEGLFFPTQILETEFKQYLAQRVYEPDARGLLSARQAIASYYARRDPPLIINPDQIFITASSSESYSLLFSLLAEPGDNLLGPSITYPLFDLLAQHLRLKLRDYRLSEQMGVWQIDPDSLPEACDTHSRAVLLVSPHNPTGMILEQPLPILNELGLPIIADEVFAEFRYTSPTCPPIGTLHPELPVFHLNGISKFFALADLKLGWIALNDVAYKRYGARLEVLNDCFLSASTWIQYALPQIFEQGQSFLKDLQTTIRERIDLSLSLLNTIDSLEVHPPAGAYYLFPKLKSTLTEEELVLKLIAKGLLVHPGYYYGTDPSPRLMLSALAQPEKLKAGIALLKQELDAQAR